MAKIESIFVSLCFSIKRAVSCIEFIVMINIFMVGTDMMELEGPDVRSVQPLRLHGTRKPYSLFSFSLFFATLVAVFWATIDELCGLLLPTMTPPGKPCAGLSQSLRKGTVDLSVE